MRTSLVKTLSFILILSIMVFITTKVYSQSMNRFSLNESILLNERNVLNFNTNWKFIEENDTNAKEINYDDADAEVVSLPHSPTLLDIFSQNREWEKVSWYRRHFSLPKSDEGKRVFVYFDAGGQINNVYVNGLFVGQGRGTFTNFEFDISEYIVFGDYDNIISVQVDSTSHMEMVPGKNTDFFFYGGLHGSAKLTIVSPLYMESVFYFTEKITDEVYKHGDSIYQKGIIEVNNKKNTVENAAIRANLKDHNGNIVSTVLSEFSIEANTSKKIELEMIVENPNLWSPDTPYLYNLETLLIVEDGVVDQETINTGLRWIKTTGKSSDKSIIGIENPEDQQILLNDQPIVLLGIGRHGQFPYIGNSATDKLEIKDVYTIKYDLGMNFIRVGHYQADKAILEACDRVGLLVEEEALSWNATPDREQHKYSVIQMMLRDRNHPSVILWSIMPNETTEMDYPLAERLELVEIAKNIDSTRLTMQEENRINNFVTDVWADHDYHDAGAGHTNPYYQPYIIGEFNDGLGRSLVMPNDSESRKFDGFYEESRRYADFMSNDTIDGINKWEFAGFWSPLYGSYGKSYLQYKSAGVYGVLRDPLNRNWFSSVMKTQLGTTGVGDVIDILTEWKKDSKTTVYVASNAKTVELFLNGKSIGKTEPNDLLDLWQPLFKFEGLIWSEGSILMAIGYNDQGQPVSMDKVYASSYDVPKDSTLILHNVTSNEYLSDHYETYGKSFNPSNIIVADGADLAYIIGELTDHNGQRVYYGTENVEVDKKYGPGTIIYGGSLYMNDGLFGIYLQSEYGKIGDTVIEAKVDIGDIYNQDHEMFEYSGDWVKNSNQVDSYNQDYMQTTKTGDKVTISFVGTQIDLLGIFKIGNGTASISIDGSPEEIVTLKTGHEKYGDLSYRSFYKSPTLSYGEHKIVITALEDNPISIDAVKVYDGEYDAYSEIIVTTQAFDAKEVPMNLNNPLANKPSIVSKGMLETLINEANSFNLDLYNYKTAIEMNSALIYASKVNDYENPTKIELESAIEGLRIAIDTAIDGLSPLVTPVSYFYTTDQKIYSGLVYTYSANNSWTISADDLYAKIGLRKVGDYVSMDFTGEAIKVYGKKSPLNGTALVYIDDVLVGNINQTDTVTKSESIIFESGPLVYGKHTIKIVIDDISKGFSIQSFSIYQDATLALIENLRDLVENTIMIDRTSYTFESIIKLDKALIDAENVLIMDNPSYEIIELSYQQLKEKTELLVPMPQSSIEVLYNNSTSIEGTTNQIFYWSNKHKNHKSITTNTQTWRKSYNNLDGAWANVNERSTGDYYSITFYGTGIDIYSKVEKAYGIGIVSVDDGESVEIDFYSENTVNNKLVYSIHDLEKGLHTIKIALKDGSKTVSFYRAIITTGLEGPKPKNETIMFDEISSSLNGLNKVFYWSNKHDAHTPITTNTQTWRKSYNNLDGAWANVNERSTGDYYSITFYGTGIDIYSKVEKAYGIGIVSVDDGESVEIDFYSENTVNNKLVYSIHDLEKGLHTIKIALKDGSKTVSFYRAVVSTGSELIPVYDVSKLDQLLRVSRLRVEVDFTPETWNNFIKVYEDALYLRTSTSTTQDQIDYVTSQLEEVIYMLKKVE